MFGKLKIENAVLDIIDNRGKTPPLEASGIELIETASIVNSNKYLNGYLMKHIIVGLGQDTQKRRIF